MIIATLTKVLAGVTLASAIATTVFLVIPHPESHNGVWLDTPLDKAVVAAGDVRVVLHSDIQNITGIFVNVELDGASIDLLRDNDLERVQRGKDAKPLSVFDQVWTVFDPGVYTLNVSVSGSTAIVRSFAVTVLEQGPVFVDTAEAGPQPTATPTPAPSETPIPEVTAPPGPSGPLVADDVVRFQPSDDDWLSHFYINAYSPEEATVILEIQITDTINDVTNDWQQYQCSNVTYNYGSGDGARYNCVVSNHTLAPPDSFKIDGTWMSFHVEYRAAIYSGDEVAYATGGSWETARRSAG